MPVELPSLTIAHAAAWAEWLTREAESSMGVWLTLAKKGVTEPTSLTYAQALDEALCVGWIDGQARKIDDTTYSQRFTPRTAQSIWSQRNVGHVARLEREGRMRARGRNEVVKAQQNGRWAAAYQGQATMEAPPELAAAIGAVAEAQAAWDGLSRQNRFAFCFALANLKTEAGRRKRIASTVEQLVQGDVPHPQKRIPAPVNAKFRKTANSSSSSVPNRPRPAPVPSRRSARIRQSSLT